MVRTGSLASCSKKIEMGCGQNGTIGTRRNCGRHMAIWQALITLLLKLSDFKRDDNLGHAMPFYGSRERDNALHAQQGGRRKIGQMNQCGLRQPSSRDVRAQRVLSRFSIDARSVDVCPKTISRSFCGKRPLLKSQKAGARCCCAHCRAAR